jgi:hypothetical protein
MIRIAKNRASFNATLGQPSFTRKPELIPTIIREKERRAAMDFVLFGQQSWEALAGSFGNDLFNLLSKEQAIRYIAKLGPYRMY